MIDLDDIVPQKGYLGYLVGGIDVAKIELQDLIKTSKLVVHFHRFVHLSFTYSDFPKFR